MNYKDTGFRLFYHNFCALPISDCTRGILEDYRDDFEKDAEDIKEANGILTYGYYDREAGMTLEVLAAAFMKDGMASFKSLRSDRRIFIRASEIMDEDVSYFSDEDGRMRKQYHDRLEQLHGYDVSEEIENSRMMDFLDDSRHPVYIDDVMVYLVKEGLKPEGCWASICGLGEHVIYAFLLNEPEQDFGCHAGSRIPFHVQEMEDGKNICISQPDTMEKISAKDLEDGSMLEQAVKKYHEKPTDSGFIDILEILRDSVVWVPYMAILSDEDQEMFEELFKAAGGKPELMEGEVFRSKGNTKLVPDIISNGEKELFFPVFSTKEAMKDREEPFSKIPQRFTDVITQMENHKENLNGIVLNAYTQNFVLTGDVLELVKNMPSRLKE